MVWIVTFGIPIRVESIDYSLRCKENDGLLLFRVELERSERNGVIRCGGFED